MELKKFSQWYDCTYTVHSEFFKAKHLNEEKLNNTSNILIEMIFSFIYEQITLPKFKLFREKRYQKWLNKEITIFLRGNEIDFNNQREYWPWKEKVDIILEWLGWNVGIEIKWPTKISSFRSIPKQLIQYSDFCDTILLVFFEIDKTISPLKEMEKILEWLSEEIKNKVFIIVL